MKHLFFVILLSSSHALACLHFPVEQSEPLKEGTKHVFMYHDGKNAHMIINTDISLTKGPLPETIAWVLPFPTMPTKFEETDAAIFSELGNLLQPPTAKEIGSGGAVRSKGAVPSPAIKVHKVRYVGKYKIHPIEILEEPAGKELSDWLSKNNFNGMPIEKQKPYLKKGAVFLAVQMKFKDKKKVRADLKPLHIVYPSPTLTFPLRFTHDDRTFSIQLYVFSPYNIMTSHRENQSYIPESYLKEVTSLHYTKKKTNRWLYPTVRKRLGNLDGYLYRFEGIDLNTPGKLLKDLKQDPFINPLL